MLDAPGPASFSHMTALPTGLLQTFLPHNNLTPAVSQHRMAHRKIYSNLSFRKEFSSLRTFYTADCLYNACTSYLERTVYSLPKSSQLAPKLRNELGRLRLFGFGLANTNPLLDDLVRNQEDCERCLLISLIRFARVVLDISSLNICGESLYMPRSYITWYTDLSCRKLNTRQKAECSTRLCHFERQRTMPAHGC